MPFWCGLDSLIPLPNPISDNNNKNNSNLLSWLVAVSMDLTAGVPLTPKPEDCQSASASVAGTHVRQYKFRPTMRK
jgi:hypothetical protein